MKFFNQEIINNKLVIGNSIFEFYFNPKCLLKFLFVYKVDHTVYSGKKIIFAGELQDNEIENNNILCIELLLEIKNYSDESFDAILGKYLLFL
jgi:hypothetical protein